MLDSRSCFVYCDNEPGCSLQPEPAVARLAGCTSWPMNTLFLTADRLFDGTGTAALIRPQMRITDGCIESTQRGLLGPPTCSGEHYDFPGCTIIPGLIDTHVHLIFSGADTHAEVI